MEEEKEEISVKKIEKKSENEKKEEKHPKTKVKEKVEHFHQLSRSSSSNQQKKDYQTCIANCDYESNVEGDLSFKKGDEMLIIERHPNHWWECELRGKRGWVSEKLVRETRGRAKSDFV